MLLTTKVNLPEQRHAAAQYTILLGNVIDFVTCVYISVQNCIKVRLKYDCNRAS